jgi:hypothetical protein
MATEAQLKAINTDYEAEFQHTLNKVQEKIDFLLDLYSKDNVSPFDMYRNLSAARWLDDALEGNVEVIQLTLERKKKRAEA